MSTFTIPAGVDVPSEVGATIHLVVPGEPCYWHDEENPPNQSDSATEPDDCDCTPPPVLAALVQKKCETCGGRFGPRFGTAGMTPQGPWGRLNSCVACAGSGFDLLALRSQRCDVYDCPSCISGRHKRFVSFGRWKVEALDPAIANAGVPPDDGNFVEVFGPRSVIVYRDHEQTALWNPIEGTPVPGGYVATLTLVVAP